MPLVEPLDADHDAEVAELARFFNETLGFPPNSVLTMQRRPAIAKAFIALNKAVMENGGRVTSEQKRLIGYVASHAAGCRYCEAHTILAAERFGANPERLRDIWDYQKSPHFTDAERAAFDFALAAAGELVIASPGPVGSLQLTFDRNAPTLLQAKGQDLRPTALGADGSVAFEVPLGAGRVHPMWWTGGRHHLYTLRFRLPDAPVKPIAFQVIQRSP